MRNLAFRFVTQPKSSRPQDVAVHVVDPYDNLQHQFDNVATFQNELKQRNVVKVDVAKVADGYSHWLASYEALKNHSQDDRQGIRHAKDRLFSHQKHYIDTLKLPNRLSNGSSIINAKFEPFPDILPLPKSNSILDAADILELRLFNTFSPIRIDPPRMVRPAVTEAFNVPKKDLIRFHEGHNPAMHLVGVTPPGLLVSFVASRFTNTNIFPLSFLTRGVGYNRSFCRWERHFVSGLLLGLDRDTLLSSLNAFRTGIEQAVSGYGQPLTQIIVPNDLRFYESSAALTSINNFPIARFGYAKTYLSERLRVEVDTTVKTKNVKFLELAFFEVDVSTMVEKLSL